MAKADRPNILILWGDDIGWWNISYNSGADGLLDPEHRPDR
jgi:arylsulfatase A-like enzyme